MKTFNESEFTLVDNKFWFPTEDKGITYSVLKNETGLLETIKPYLRDNKVMVQAGGNCGMQVIKFADFFDYVYTFEPEPKNFHCLNRNLIHRNVIKIQACIGDERGLVNLSAWGNETRGFESGGYHVGSRGGYIPTLMIDDLGLDACDLIQLDVEGYQLKAMKGAIQTIKKFKPVICTEHAWIDRYGGDSDQIKSFLKDLGYYCVGGYTTDTIYVYERLSSKLTGIL